MAASRRPAVYCASEDSTMNRLNGRMMLMAWAVIGCALAPAVALAQLPNVGSMLPDKTQLPEHDQKLVTELTAMKSSGKLGAADAGKADSLAANATALSTELATPMVSPS